MNYVHYLPIEPGVSLKDQLQLRTWTAEEIKIVRKALDLRQQDIADIVGLSKGSIASLETEHSANPWALIAYGIILERYYAYTKGYVSAFRKIGENEFAEVKLLQPKNFPE